MIGSIVDIAHQRHLESAPAFALDDSLGWFERLLADLSATFTAIPCDQVERVIQEALPRIAAALDLDRTSLWVAEDGDLIQSHEWIRPGGWSVPVPSSATRTRTSARELFPWSLERINAGEIVQFANASELPRVTDQESYRRSGMKSAVLVPLVVGGRRLGALVFGVARAERSWRLPTVQRLRLVASAFAEMLARREAAESLRGALAQVSHVKDELRAEDVCMRRDAPQRAGTSVVIGKSAPVRRVLEQVQQVAATDSTVLLLGETGSGKEMFASQVHELSSRRARPMVRVNCAAIPATLMESELFGREKGAFTGALARQAGRFEMADRSTIFLDEIGDLPAEVQVKLLRVLEERQIERLGSPKPIRVDTRIIAATHRNLEQLIADGTFREDLYYRLCVFPIRVPPLRERVEDIPLLVWRFVGEFAAAFGKRVDSISTSDMRVLQQYAWPGNIRELRNVVERAMIVGRGPHLTFTLPSSSAVAPKSSSRLKDVEREHIRSVLQSTGWRVRGLSGAAEILGLRPTTLESRLAKLGLKRPS